MLRQAKERVKFAKAKGRRSYYDAENKVVYYGTDASTGTIAHELFHEIDSTYGLTEDGFLSQSVKNDYTELVNLAKEYGKSVEEMLYFKYPKAFYTNSVGALRVYDKYRGISDILHGASNKQIFLGFGHSKVGYWDSPMRLEKETFAQFGRILYEQDSEVIRMVEEMFPDAYKETIERLEGIIK